MFKRSNGILLHISSLPGEYGIGDFGKEAYNFVDFLDKSGVTYWQILPLGMTGYGDSPYQSFSAFAGNPYFIDLDELIEKGFLSVEEVRESNLNKEPQKVDYFHLYKEKMKLLKKAYERGKDVLKNSLEEYYQENFSWLQEFALYMAIKKAHGEKSLLEWDKRYRDWRSPAVREFVGNHQEEIFFWVFTQYYFDRQWHSVKKYANDKGIEIIGDLPIYVSEDSADVWRNPELFRLDQNLKPITVAGCPPDAFSSTGQLWGNPIYNWEGMKDSGYKWWIKRIKHSFKLYDVLRIDHFRGFEAYWEVPFEEDTAIFGEWTKGPGIELFEAIKQELGELKIIAEDLGYLTPEVEELIKDSGFPGMKVLQFAFDPREESDYLPHNYTGNSVVYTGTHDNHTILGWMENIPKDQLDFAKRYMKLDEREGFSWGMIRGAWSSVSDIAVAPMQDFLELGDEARMNIPSTLGENWDWRMENHHLNEDLSRRVYDLNKTYGRL